MWRLKKILTFLQITCHLPTLFSFLGCTGHVSYFFRYRIPIMSDTETIQFGNCLYPSTWHWHAHFLTIFVPFKNKNYHNFVFYWSKSSSSIRCQPIDNKIKQWLTQWDSIWNIHSPLHWKCSNDMFNFQQSLFTSTAASHTGCMLYKLYVIQTASYTACISCSLYDIQHVSHTACMLCSLYVIQTVCHTCFMSYRLHHIQPASHTAYLQTVCHTCFMSYMLYVIQTTSHTACITYNLLYDW